MINKCCPICKSSEIVYVFESLPQCEGCSVVKCTNCCHFYSLVLQFVETHQLYNDQVYKVVENRNSIFDKILSWEYGKVIRKLSCLRPAKGNLLDFGGGKGKFCSLAQENGWSVKCVETAIDRAAYAREVYHLDVYTSFYESGQIFEGVKFDIITIFHVLEHLTDPEKLLNNLVSDNLNPKGLLVIEVPNIYSWQARLAKHNWLHLDVPRHIQHFTPHRLKQMLNDMNFHILSTTFWSFHLGVLGMIDSLMKCFGYNGNIIFDLKNKRNVRLVAQVGLMFPVAFLLESMAAIVGRGGVIRMYLVRN